MLLTTLIGAIAILSSWSSIADRIKEYYVCLLVLQTAMIGAFVSLDALLFFLFWEVMLVPMYFLIGIWGGGRRLYSAIKFFLYTLAGSVVMLLGILALYFYAHSSYRRVHVRHPPLPRAHHPRRAADLDLPGVLLRVRREGTDVPAPHVAAGRTHRRTNRRVGHPCRGDARRWATYGFLRFSLPVLPEASRQFVPVMAGLAIVGIIYGALVALAQSDWKRLVAYSSVSHMGMAMLGMFALTPLGISGSIVHQLNHGISTGALFLLVGMIYERRHTREISAYGGLSAVMPVFATIFFVMTMSSIGLPGAQRLHRRAPGPAGRLCRQQNLGGRLPARGIVLGAAYMLWLYQRTMFGRVDNPANASLLDLNRREVATLMPLVALAVWIGVYPASDPASARFVGGQDRGAREFGVRPGDCESRGRLQCGGGAGAGADRAAGDAGHTAVHRRQRRVQTAGGSAADALRRDLG